MADSLELDFKRCETCGKPLVLISLVTEDGSRITAAANFEDCLGLAGSLTAAAFSLGNLPDEPTPEPVREPEPPTLEQVKRFIAEEWYEA